MWYFPKMDVSKLRAMHQPAQSGKGGKMIDVINRQNECIRIAGSTPGTMYANIIITSNNCLLVDQTSKRFNNDIVPIKNQSKVYAWTSVGKDTRTSVEYVSMLILEHKVHTIVCCTNSLRISKVADMIKKLDVFPDRLDYINIWIDEGDANLRMLIKNDFMALASLRVVKSITFVSATMDAVYKHFPGIPIYTYPEAHPAAYLTYAECEITIDDEPYEKSNEEQYIKYIFEKHSRCIQPGSRWFIPGNTRKNSHEVITRELFAKGFNVLILNSDRKEIRFYDRPLVTLSLNDVGNGDLELGHLLCSLYKEYEELRNAPFAVTGHLCLGRGITFNSKLLASGGGHEFMFNYAILPTIPSKANAYQFTGRLLGNVKHFETFKTPRIFTTTRMDKKIRDQENLAINLPKNLHNDGRDVPTGDDLRQARANNQDIDHRVFQTEDEAIAFAREELRIRFNRRKGSYPKDLLEPDGGFASLHKLLARKWGLSARDGPRCNKARQLPIREGGWVVIWRPSFFPASSKKRAASEEAEAPPPAKKMKLSHE